MNMTTNTIQACTPRPPPVPAVIGPISRGETPSLPIPCPDPEAIERGHQARQARVAEWAALTLRQQWADESFMRDHLRAAGVRIGRNLEPATTTRLRSVLRGVGIQGPETQEAVGCGPEKFLALNPSLPLWAAVALVLEATGRFSVAVAG